MTSSVDLQVAGPDRVSLDLRLADLRVRLAPRIQRERDFERSGRKLRHKSWLFRNEKYWLRPGLKAGLQAVGLYQRGLQNAVEPVLRRVRLGYPNLPERFSPYTVLHLSDFHIDGVPGLDAAVARLLADISVDMCVITGDYRFLSEGSTAGVYEPMRRVIRSIRARDGIYAILGNHDVAEIAFQLERDGVRMLINEAVAIRRGKAEIWVAGVDDPFDYRTDDLPGALASVPPHGFTILLAHTPELYEEASRENVDLYLAGHTHAGQIQLPLLGCVRHNCDIPKAYAAGHWHRPTRKGKMHGFTSAGLGCSSLPIRFLCPPEAVLFELVSI